VQLHPLQPLIPHTLQTPEGPLSSGGYACWAIEELQLSPSNAVALTTVLSDQEEKRGPQAGDAKGRMGAEHWILSSTTTQEGGRRKAGVGGV
jgi:hypothetical protein